MNTRSILARAAVSVAIAVVSMLNVSCVGQRIKDPTTGLDIVQVTVMAKATMEKKPDGTFKMTANAEKAADNLGKYGGALLNAKLIGQGVDAVKSLGNNAVDTIK